MMTEFFEKTWFVWWVFACVVILRWFHVISSSHDIAVEADPGHGEDSASPNSVPQAPDLSGPAIMTHSS